MSLMWPTGFDSQSFTEKHFPLSVKCAVLHSLGSSNLQKYTPALGILLNLVRFHCLCQTLFKHCFWRYHVLTYFLEDSGTSFSLILFVVSLCYSVAGISLPDLSTNPQVYFVILLNWGGGGVETSKCSTQR